MKVSWVLSDEERHRRFNKFHKSGTGKNETHNSAVQKFNSQKSSLVLQPSFAFTMEEVNVLNNVLSKFDICKDTFVHNLITMSKTAVASLIQHAYDIRTIEYQEFQCIMKTIYLILVNTVIPQFSEMETISYVDRDIITKNQTIKVFKSQLCMDYDKENEMSDLVKQENIDYESEEVEELVLKNSQGVKLNCVEKSLSCPIKRQVRMMSLDKTLMNSLGIEHKLSNLNLEDSCPKLPKYQDLYRNNWARDPNIEKLHRELTFKVARWPILNQQHDPKMIALMTTILIFNAETPGLVDRGSVEKVQLKYLLLLQRYLKSQLQNSMEANQKFLEAMYILSYTRDLRDLEDHHVNKSKIIC